MSLFNRILRIVPILVLIGVAILPLRSVLAANDRRCFPEVAPAIQDCIEGQFRSYWEANGGLAVFGYPISSARPEVNRDTGATYLTQYFERQRFEYHPENQGVYAVLTGRLGDDVLRQSGRDWRTLPTAAPTTPHYMPETGHAIGENFFAYWDAHGLDFGDPGVSDRESLALFGYPLSEPAMETNSSGDRVLTQYFERARLEYHPNQPAAHRILEGLLGSETFSRRGDDQPRPSTSPSGSASPAPSGSASPVPSGSASPSPSASGSPAPSSSASPSGSASPSPSPSDDDDDDDDRSSPSPSPSDDDDDDDDDRSSPSPSASPRPDDDDRRGRR